MENGLASMCDAAAVQHREGVAGAVADRQDDMVGVDLLAAGQRQRRACGGRRRSIDVLDARSRSGIRRPALRSWRGCSPPWSPAERCRYAACCGEDFLRRAGFDEFGQHLAGQVAGVLDLAVELAVGECAGAAFAELHVGFRVEHAAAPQAPGVLGALAHHLAAFEDDRPKTHLRQDQGGEQAARAGADDDGAFGWGGGVDGEAVARVGGRADGRDAAAQERGFVADLDVDGVDEADRGAAAGVVASAGDVTE